MDNIINNSELNLIATKPLHAYCTRMPSDEVTIEIPMYKNLKGKKYALNQ